jgi:ABC-type uncharacterized transport system permease subunit
MLKRGRLGGELKHDSQTFKGGAVYAIMRVLLWAMAIMTNPVLNFSALVLYLAAAALMWWYLARGQSVSGGRKIAVFALASGAVVLHAVVLTGAWTLALTGAFSLVALVVTCLFLIAWICRPVEILGIAVLPLTAFTVILEWLWPGHPTDVFASRIQSVHVVVSILAYGLLALAAIQSLVLWIQERQLRHNRVNGFIQSLPPMQTMETLMFQMIGAGFLLLTLTLITGVTFSESVFGQPIKFTHHIVLAVIAWAVYATLLFGRWWLGWRGRIAANWALSGFGLLLLAYFGTKFVLEVILQRGA